ncbi:MAG TPA: hypothetical protein VHT96_16525 [Clostridia bacterium]|nr:hypothetical protein [Clostridia bacterium]
MSIQGIGRSYAGAYGGYFEYGYADFAPSAGAGSVSGPGAGQAAAKASGTADLKAMKRSGAIECQTCKSRTYQDVSNDPGVSFKAPGHIDPASAGAVVMGHEQEHVSNAKASAASNGSRVVSQSVRLFTAVCPECGRSYVSGGETRTVTRTDKNAGQPALRNKGNSSYSSRKHINITV